MDGKPLSRPQEIERLKTPGAHTLTLLRDGQEVVLRLTWREGVEKLGVVYQPEVRFRRVSLPEGLLLAAGRILSFGPEMVRAWWEGFSGSSPVTPIAGW